MITYLSNLVRINVTISLVDYGYSASKVSIVSSRKFNIEGVLGEGKRPWITTPPRQVRGSLHRSRPNQIFKNSH